MSIKVNWIGGRLRRPIVLGTFIHQYSKNQCTLEFIVDTGADRTVITPEWQQILGIPDSKMRISPLIASSITGDTMLRYLNECTLVFLDVNSLPHVFKNLTIFFGIQGDSTQTAGKHYNVLGRDILGEDFIHTFFNVPAIVEVFITEKLTRTEVGIFYFHIAELQAKGVAKGIVFLGEHSEGEGSVLRFQGSSFDEIYASMSDLLAPFRMTEAIDWQHTLAIIPVEERNEVAASLANTQLKVLRKYWQVAERMAKMLYGFRNAKVYQIQEKGERGIRIDVFTNDQIARKLSLMDKSDEWDEEKPLIIVKSNQGTIIQAKGVKDMGDKINIEGDNILGAVGRSASVDAHNIKIYKNVVRQSTSLDSELKDKLLEACEKVEEMKLSHSDEDDVVDAMGKLTEEISKTEPEGSRIRRLLNTIKEIAPLAAAILSTAETIAKFLE